MSDKSPFYIFNDGVLSRVLNAQGVRSAPIGTYYHYRLSNGNSVFGICDKDEKGIFMPRVVKPEHVPELFRAYLLIGEGTV